MKELNEKDFIDRFSFMLAQEIAKAAPKDTGTMARSFPATVKTKDNKISFTVPFYTEYVEFGTFKQNPNPFIRNTLRNKSEEIAQKVFDSL